MEITTTQHNLVTVVTLVGRIDTSTADEVTNYCLKEVEAGKTKLVADFSGVDYVSSAGLRTLMVVAKTTRKQKGDFRLANLQAEILRVINVSGFGSIMKIYPDVVSAITSFE